ncbi:MAG: glycosyltransferase family 4 protein [Planctomycetota bacterium]|nr:glycosyltransferase family 4 protein [Planctomycetota bacterium]
MTNTEPTTSDLRVVILNQYYVPDVASTGHLLSELAEYLASHQLDVNVIACQPSYGPPETWEKCPRYRVESGIKVLRMWTTRFPKDRILGRTINSMTFLIQLFVRLMFRPNRGEIFLYTTNPPYLGVLGGFISLFRQHPYVVLLHDSYPQLAVLVGKIRKDGMIAKVWHRLNRFMYKRARHTIVLCEAAKKLVCENYDIDPERVHIIHNWADPEELVPKPKAESEFAQQYELVEPFTVLYSGNLGLYYEFETILNAAERLKDENFRLVFVGAGGKRDWIEAQIRDRKLSNTLLLPYQPFEKLPDSLTASDASLVTIDKGVEGISYPSKLYASLAIGRPILALSEGWSELRNVVEKEDVGFWFELGDDERLAECIRGMMNNPARGAAQGHRARELFLREFTMEVSADKYKDVLKMAHPTTAVS